jgi:hypothetical protein
MKIKVNGTNKYKAVIYDIEVDGLSYEYVEHENEKGKLIDYTLTTYNGYIVRDDDILTAIQDYLERKGY